MPQHHLLKGNPLLLSLSSFLTSLCQHCSLCLVEVKDLNSIGKFRKSMYQDDDSQVGEAGD